MATRCWVDEEGGYVATARPTLRPLVEAGCPIVSIVTDEAEMTNTWLGQGGVDDPIAKRDERRQPVL